MASPPTRRVIAVMEFLIRAESPLTTTELASQLGIARPTASAILRELEAAGWVHRDYARAYSVSARISSLAQPAIDEGGVRSVLERLTLDLDCGLTLSQVKPDQLKIVHKVHAKSRKVRGLPVGKAVKLTYRLEQWSWRGEMPRISGTGSPDLGQSTPAAVAFC